MEYRYEHFKRELLAEDGSFRTGPGPGEVFPPFDLPTTSGGGARLDDYYGRPLLLTFASYMWSNPGAPLRDALQAVVAGEPVENPERQTVVVPMLRGIVQGDDLAPPGEECVVIRRLSAR